MNLIDRIVLAVPILQRIDLIQDLVYRIETLGNTLDRLQAIERKMPNEGVLEALAARLDALDQAVRKIETSAKPPIQETQALAANPKVEDLREWERLKLLSKFVQLSGKAKEIELEWQRIQQDEHDFQFAFQTSPNEETQAKYLFKKGIAEGVKWCVNRFS